MQNEDFDYDITEESIGVILRELIRRVSPIRWLKKLLDRTSPITLEQRKIIISAAKDNAIRHASEKLGIPEQDIKVRDINITDFYEFREVHCAEKEKDDHTLIC